MSPDVQRLVVPVYRNAATIDALVDGGRRDRRRGGRAASRPCS